MAGWQTRWAPYLHALEKRFDAIKYWLRYRLRGPGPLRIEAYLGYGSAHNLYLKGRVLEDRNIQPPGERESLWQNLKDTLKRVASREAPGARLAARFQGVEHRVQADEEGMFEVNIRPAAPLAVSDPWVHVELELLAPRGRGQRGPVTAEGLILVPPPSARLGIISDIDDTVVQTSATDLLRAARTVLLGSARTRLPFPGVAALYRALHAGGPEVAGNPIFYVSNGPWNLYDVVLEFLRLQDIPLGPLFLRNWGIDDESFLPTDKRGHKLDQIRRILETYAHLPFILVGDSGEADAEIYAEVVRENQGRILAVYIRNVLPDADPVAIMALAEQVAAAGSTLILARDSLAMAQHAAEQGWITAANAAEIEAEVNGLP